MGGFRLFGRADIHALKYRPMHPLHYSPARLRAIRVETGLTRSDLALACGMSPGTIKDYEAGRHAPGAFALGRLATALGCSVDDFYTRFRFEAVSVDVAA